MTEAEYEFVCRAGTSTKHCFGESTEVLQDYCWCLPDAVTETQPVGQKRPNALGFFDLYGNARQWCLDVYGPYPPEEIIVDTHDYLPSESARVIRGSDFNAKPQGIESAERGLNLPRYGFSKIGLRLACSIEDKD